MSLSFEVDDELQAVVEAVRAFSSERLRPALRELEEQGGLPEALLRECHELGLTTLALPAAFGGDDRLDLRAGCLCAEELARGDVGAAVAISGPRSAGALVLALGDAEQQERLLRPFADPEQGWDRRGALALVEGPFGLEPAAIETTATPEGDGWVLRGRKRYVQGAGVADLTLVLARDVTSRAPDPWDRLAVFAVSGRPAGLRTGERARTMGLGTARFADLELDGLRVAGRDRLGSGAPGEVRRAVLATVARKKVLDAARLVGCMRAATEYACKYAGERQAFGVPLHQHQALAFMMADMATAVDAARNLVWEAAWALDTGQPGAQVSALRAHRQAAEAAVQVTTDAVQVLGGHGYVQDHPVEKWMRDAVTLGVVDGLSVDDEADLAAELLR